MLNCWLDRLYNFFEIIIAFFVIFYNYFYRNYQISYKIKLFIDSVIRKTSYFREDIPLIFFEQS